LAGNKTNATVCLASDKVALFDSLSITQWPDSLVDVSLVGFGGTAQLASGGFVPNDDVDLDDFNSIRGVLTLRDLDITGHLSFAFNGSVVMCSGCVQGDIARVILLAACDVNLASCGMVAIVQQTLRGCQTTRPKGSAF
jgi:hypothetical protein